jgi:hypothetical protein
MATPCMHNVRKILLAGSKGEIDATSPFQSSKKQFENLKNDFSGPEEVDGYDEIP